MESKYYSSTSPRSVSLFKLSSKVFDLQGSRVDRHMKGQGNSVIDSCTTPKKILPRVMQAEGRDHEIHFDLGVPSSMVEVELEGSMHVINAYNRVEFKETTAHRS